MVPTAGLSKTLSSSSSRIQKSLQWSSLVSFPFGDVLKSKAVPLHAMEALGGRGDIAPTHSRPRHYMGGEWSTSRHGRALPPGKGPPVPIVQEAGWAPEPIWTQRIEEKSFLPGIEPRSPGRPVRNKTLY
jgi:hypothetical protein